MAKRRRKAGSLNVVWQTQAEQHAAERFDHYQRLAVKWWRRLQDERKRSRRLVAKLDAEAEAMAEAIASDDGEYPWRCPTHNCLALATETPYRLCEQCNGWWNNGVYIGDRPGDTP